MMQTAPAGNRSIAASLAATELRDAHAEAACIACAMVSQEYALDVVAIPADYFICGENAIIIQVMRDLYDRGTPINFVTVKDELLHRRFNEQTLFERVGGAAGLAAFRAVKVEAGGRVKASEDDAGIFATLKEAIEIVTSYGAARKIVDELADVRMELIGKSIRPVEAIVRVRAIVAASELGVTTYARSQADDAERYRARLDDLGKGLVMGVPTGFKGYDQRVGGMFGGEVVLLNGPLKNAKSALGMNVVDFSARGYLPSALFTTEMRADQVRDRLVVMRSGGLLEMDQFKGGVKIVSPKDLRTMHEVWDMISKEPFYIVPKLCDADLALMEAERLILQKGIKLLAFDFLHNFQSAGKGEREALNYMSQGTKNIANKYAEWGVIVLNLGQLNTYGNVAAKQYGDVSSANIHMGVGPAKDADVITNIWLEPQEFYCQCRVQTKPREFRMGRTITTRDVPLWETYPAGGMCSKTDGGCGYRVERKPVRKGKWNIESGRSTGDATDIWFEFDGAHMSFRELGDYSEA